MICRFLVGLVTYAVSGSHLDQEGIIAVTSRGFKETARVSLGVDLQIN
jgi:hypothetical protein